MSGASCIICLEGGDLMSPSPCSCKGSNGIHYECLRRVQRNYVYCGVCRSHYNVLCDGVHSERTPCGKRIEYETVAGKKHGLFEEYDEGGIILKRAVFACGVLHGPYYVYHEDGRRIMVECSYENGKKEGPLYEYNEEGQIMTAENYKRGLKHGVVKEYYDSGVLFQIYNMHEGEKLGEFKEFDSEGSLVFHCNYRKNGVCEVLFNNLHSESRVDN